MKNEKLQGIQTFSESDLNSATEEDFASSTMQAFFDEKMKEKYSEKLDKEFDVRKQAVSGSGLSKKSSNKQWKYILISSLALLLALTLYFLPKMTKDNPEELMYAFKNELYTPIDANVRGTISEDQKRIQNLTNAYESKDFTLVVSEYEKLSADQNELDQNVLQIAAVAYGSLSQYEKSIEAFAAVLKKPESNYSNHSTVRYQLGLVYIQNDEPSKAKEVLEAIKVGDYKYDEAQKILETI